jgi:hypothetical protein
MKPGYLVLLVVFVLIAGGGWYYVRTHPAIPSTTTGLNPGASPYSYSNASGDTITVDTPQAGAVVGKSFSILGHARGPWFFEASFPIEVVDGNGTVIATAIAKAQGDWMTNDLVPFKADLMVPTSYIGPATIRLKNDNPSGDPKNAASLSYPITVQY